MPEVITHALLWTKGGGMIALREQSQRRNEMVPIGPRVESIEHAQVIASWLQDALPELREYLRQHP